MDLPEIQERLRPLFSGLFPAAVLVDVMQTASADPADMFPAERAIITGAVSKRQREFCAARQLAHGLLSHLDVDPSFPLLNGPDRVPVWPPGIVGTIAHGGGIAVVAVARAEHFRGLGIDVEPGEALPDGLEKHVCSPAESRWAKTFPIHEQGRALKLIFCIKEALYKAQYLVTRQFLDFDAFTVDPDTSSQTFEAVLRKPLPGFRAGHRFPGAFYLDDHWALSGVTIETISLSDYGHACYEKSSNYVSP